MARSDGRRRAAPYNIAHYADQTRRRYAREQRYYLDDAARAGVTDPDHPPLEWLRAYAQELVQISAHYAQKRFNGISYHFRLGGAPDQTRDESIQAVLSAPQQQSAIDRVDKRAFPASRRAAYFAERAVGSRRNDQRRSVIAFWEAYAADHRFEPLYPPLHHVAAVLANYGVDHRYHTVRNFASALSGYFIRHGVDDATRSQEVCECLQGIRRTQPPEPAEPLFAEDLRRMVLPLGSAPLDIRDRFLAIVCAYGPLPPRVIRAIRLSDVRLDADGIVLVYEGRDWFIGGVDDPELDVRLWFRRWLALFPERSGPLFCGMLRGAWKRSPLSEQRISYIIRNLAAKAGVSTARTRQGLQKGFAIRATRKAGGIVTAAQMHYKSLRSLERHVPAIIQSRKWRKAHFRWPGRNELLRPHA